MKFVVIASNRTGSTHLTDLLNHQKDVLCHGELLKPRSRSGRYGLRWPKEEMKAELLLDFMRLREQDPQAFLARIFAQDYGAAAVGFKIFEGQNDVALDLLISDASVRKVVLLRRNVLAVYSSSLIWREIGRHNVKVHRYERPEIAPVVEFQEKQFRRFCSQYLGFYRAIFRRLAQVGQSFHLVNYDQINDPWHFANLLVFVGAAQPEGRVEARYVKQNSPDILSRFSNPDEVDIFLAEHGLKDWRYEPETSLDFFGKSTDNDSGSVSG